MSKKLFNVVKKGLRSNFLPTKNYMGWINEALQNGAAARESLWTKSI